ncbi:MAG TPA: pyruvate formate lyase family protein [Armatimonadota bacterium]|jgi:pyruvate-formate lyase|nr:hypothetical protein [Armatimonadota bacterium]HOJ20352.1 pyruvate formate lyase family protein [Armatimonadota bacterium]HOM80748.1 pyruvate formate lyase family protein [Armatimonadota bacterium]HPO73902.1 pyruvate formate lyase family protein [Armatimonadota bacterium]HPT98538.1 pyruvate formate lyase family protein [Armatimonadota bacterium]
MGTQATVRPGAQGEAARRRIEEAYRALREKDVRCTTLERVRLLIEADAAVQGLPQPLQLGHGLTYLLERIGLPLSPDDQLLGRIHEEVPDPEGERLFQEAVTRWGGDSRPAWLRDSGHECFAWERLLRLGLSGLEAFARSERERRKAEGAKEASLHFLKGAELVYAGLRAYARRYAAAARAAGLEEAGARCAAIAERPPRHFAEALQLIWLVGHVYCTMVAANPTLTFGRLDGLLLPFYREDLAAGRLTPDEAGDLIEEFYCKNNLILGRGEHQMGGDPEKDTGWRRNLCYDSPQYVVLGGHRRDGSPVANDLTRLFLERVVPGFKNPVIVLRWTDDLPEPLWRLACEKMRANASMMVYNDAAVIPALVDAGIAEEDAVTYTMHGCNWPDVPGIQRTVSHCEPPLPKLFLTALLGGEGETPPVLPCIDTLYARFFALFRQEVAKKCDEIRAHRARWDELAPGTLRVDDCFLDGPVARARSWQLGGVQYHTITCTLHSLATTADCFAVVDELVFRARRVSLEELREALRTDFAECEPLRRLCQEAPKFGRDDDCADRHAVRLIEGLLAAIDEASGRGTPEAVTLFRCLETDMRHRLTGAQTGATPDGRHAGMPTSENTSPSPGSCTRGLTAMLHSLAKLPLHRICSGALNIRLQPRLVAGEEGLSRLAALLRAYFRMGGLQAQLSLADTATLRDAQEQPEAHRDLVVRITGYSALFTDMTRGAQEEIIRREEHAA